MKKWFTEIPLMFKEESSCDVEPAKKERLEADGQ